ncbi:DUF3085 domain-containing protein [Pseudomonas sp. Ant30-3]|uniref:DUF3085 domain-containing protein n=1 Tax=Pseudomonas sp. Ant30-3 TaxID=1488328 RepID=UPI00048BB5FB|nr:DUF3085 domain-containing protein [Pseudomonas sp. Ant30-3]
MLRFKGTNLRPVLAEAIAHKGRLILAKDHGVYFLAEFGERTPDGQQKLLAYAVGCDPDIDPFDNWWELARTELGGDDFGEFLDPHDAVFTRILNSEDDLELSATPTQLSLQAVASKPGKG